MRIKFYQRFSRGPLNATSNLKIYTFDKYDLFKYWLIENKSYVLNFFNKWSKGFISSYHYTEMDPRFTG